MPAVPSLLSSEEVSLAPSTSQLTKAQAEKVSQNDKTLSNNFLIKSLLKWSLLTLLVIALSWAALTFNQEVFHERSITKIEKLPIGAPNVVKRKSSLERIHSLFAAGTNRVAIVGDSATGKTELSKQFARTYREQYHHVWFVQTEHWRQYYKNLAVEWKLFSSEEIERVELEIVIAKVHEVFSDLPKTKSLIIFDNAPKGFIEKALKGNLPKNTHILLTSIWTDWPNAKTMNLTLDTDCHMTGEERMEVLTKWVSDPKLFDLKEAKKIVERFELSPVVIAQAGRFIERTQTPMSQYLETFDENVKQVLAQGAINSPQGDREIDVFVSLKIQLEEMLKRSQSDPSTAQALTLLQYVVQLPSKNIPKPFILEVLGVENLELNPLLERLDFLIVKDRDTISIHDLFQKIVLTVFRQNAQLIEKVTLSKLAQVAEEYAEFLMGDPKKAIAIYTQGIEDEMARPQPDRLKIGKRFSRLGDIHFQLVEWKNAVVSYEKALKHLEQANTIQKEDVATNLKKIGDALYQLGDLNESLKYYNNSLKLYVELFGEKHSCIATIWNEMGAIYGKLGQYKQALKFEEKALELRQELFGVEHPSVAASLNDIGFTHWQLGNYHQALEYHQRAFKLAKTFYGEGHLSTASSLNRMGRVLNSLGKYEEALKHYQKALNIRQEILGEDHPKVAPTLSGMGTVLRNLGKYEEALNCQKKALEINQKFRPESHQEIATILGRMTYVIMIWEDMKKH